MRGGKWVSFLSRPGRGTKRSRATLTTSGLKQGCMGVGSPGPGRLWRQAEPGRWRKTHVAMLWKARWQRRCPRGTGRGRREEGRARHDGGRRSPLLPSSPRLEWGWERMVSEKQRPALGAGMGAASSCPPPRPPPGTHCFVILESWKVTKIRSRRFSRARLSSALNSSVSCSSSSR